MDTPFGFFFLCEFKLFFFYSFQTQKYPFSLEHYNIFCLFLSVQNMSPLCKVLYQILLIMCTYYVKPYIIFWWLCVQHCPNKTRYTFVLSINNDTLKQSLLLHSAYYVYRIGRPNVIIVCLLYRPNVTPYIFVLRVQNMSPCIVLGHRDRPVWMLQWLTTGSKEVAQIVQSLHCKHQWFDW